MTIEPGIQYLITITGELPLDPIKGSFGVNLVPGQTFVVVGGGRGHGPDGCLYDTLNPDSVQSQFPNLGRCTNMMGFSSVNCTWMSPTGCGVSFQIDIGGVFPKEKATTEIKVTLQGDNCTGGTGRNQYTATATWMGPASTLDAGVDE